MKTLLLLGAWLWALGASAQAVAPPSAVPQVVVLRVVDYQTKATIFVARGAGQTEEIEIKTPFMGYDKSMVLVSEGYQVVLQKLYQEGYRLQSTVSSAGFNGPGPLVFTMLLVRDK